MRRHLIAHRVLLGLVATTLSAATFGSPAAAQGPERIDLPDGWQPEGITSNGASVVYVGSLADGGIWRGNVRTGVGDVFVPGEPGRVAVGVDYEAAHERLWVAGGDTGQVHVFDARSGELLRTYQLETGFLNDVTVTPAGAFVTDSNNAQLMVIPIGRAGALPPEDAATLLPLSGDIRYQNGFNANGIVSVGGWLILVQSNTGQLFRVDPATGTTFAIATEGVDLTGGDGLEVLGDILYVVRGGAGRISVLELGPLLDRATPIAELASTDLAGPTTVTVADDRLFAVDARFGVDSPTQAAYWITRLPLRP